MYNEPDHLVPLLNPVSFDQTPTPPPHRESGHILSPHFHTSKGEDVGFFFPRNLAMRATPSTTLENSVA